MSTLDRYVFASWVRIFVLTALGFPIVSILINLTDTLNKLLDRGLTMREIAVSYVYSIPENMFLVHAGGGAVRHGVHRGRHGAALRAHRGQGGRPELPPADAADRSWRRRSPRCWRSWWASWPRERRRKQLELQKAQQARPTRLALQLRLPRRRRAGSTPSGRSTSATRQLKQVLFERQGTGLDYPGLVITADSAS